MPACGIPATCRWARHNGTRALWMKNAPKARKAAQARRLARTWQSLRHCSAGMEPVQYGHAKTDKHTCIYLPNKAGCLWGILTLSLPDLHFMVIGTMMKSTSVDTLFSIRRLEVALQQIKKNNLVNEVYNQLLQMLASGEYAEGSKLPSETSFAKRWA